MITPIALDEIRGGQRRALPIPPSARRCCACRWTSARAEIYLKLENLQPIGSFKLRGAGNAMALLPRDRPWPGAWRRRARAIWRRAWPGTRAGWASPVRWSCRIMRRKPSWTRFGGWAGRSSSVPFERWWQIIVSGECGEAAGLLHPSGEQSRCHRRQRHDRPGDPRGLARCRRGGRPLRRGRIKQRDRVGRCAR